MMRACTSAADSYQRVKESQKQEILMEKAKMITTMELLYPMNHVYAKWMHVLEPKIHVETNVRHAGLPSCLLRCGRNSWQLPSPRWRWLLLRYIVLVLLLTPRRLAGGGVGRFGWGDQGPARSGGVGGDANGVSSREFPWGTQAVAVGP